MVEKTVPAGTTTPLTGGSGSGGIILNSATLINVAMWIAFVLVAVLILRWMVAFAMWKWQDIIDRRAHEQQIRIQNGRAAPSMEEEDDANPPPTHWTSKKPSRRRNVN
jgi:hypothetical protein